MRLLKRRLVQLAGRIHRYDLGQTRGIDRRNMGGGRPAITNDANLKLLHARECGGCLKFQDPKFVSSAERGTRAPLGKWSAGRISALGGRRAARREAMGIGFRREQSPV